MSSKNLFEDVDESEDIFGGGSSVKVAPNDDLFGEDDVQVRTYRSRSGGFTGRSRSGLKNESTEQAVNGHSHEAGIKEEDDDEFVVVSPDEVPSPQEAEDLVKNIDSSKEVPVKLTADDDDDFVYSKAGTYEERARLRREQRQVKSSKTSIPNKPNPPQDRQRRSISPSPSPPVEDEKEKTKRTSIVISVHSRSTTPTSSRTSSRIGSPPPFGEDNFDTTDNKMESGKTESQSASKLADATAQIHELTEQLQQEHSEKESLAYDNAQLREQLDEMRAKVIRLEEALKKKDTEFEEDIKKKDTEFEEAIKKKDTEFEEAIKKKDTEFVEAIEKKDTKFEEAIKKKDTEFEEAMKKKDNEIESLKSAKSAKAPNSPALKKLNARPSSADAAKTRIRPGVDKSRPIASVKDSVKKFSKAGSAGSPEVKRVVQPRKSKVKTEGEIGAKAEEGAKASESGGRASSAKGDKPVPSTKKPTKPAAKKPEPKKPVSNNPTPSAHTSVKPPPATKQTKEQSVPKESMEKPLDVSPPSSANEIPIKTEDKVLRVETTPPPIEPDNKVILATEAVDMDKEQKDDISEQSEEIDDPSTRARRVISLFEEKASKVEADIPPWKRQLQSREQSREGSVEPTDSKKPSKDVKPNTVTSTTSRPQSRSQSNASDVPPAPKVEIKPSPVEPVKPVIPFPVESVKPVIPSPVEPVKPVIPLPVEPEETTDGVLQSKDEVVLREKPISIKKVTSTNDLITPAKQRLMAEDNTSKRSSWAGNKREECATCGKVVYAMERLEADKVVYHKTCFKCTVCKKTLSTGTYAALQGRTYCKVHFKQLFKMKGNYDEGFGREQHKTKWSKKTSVSDVDQS